MSTDLTTLTSRLAAMKQTMVNRLIECGDSSVTISSPMQDIVNRYSLLTALNYDTSTITENGTYVTTGGKTGFNNFVVNVPAGGPATHKKYQLLDRVYEELNGTSIGTVGYLKYDANGTEYAVVFLDAAYRTKDYWLTANADIPGLTDFTDYNVWQEKETATYNCDTILAACAASSGAYTSPAVSHCRSYSFYISGTLYEGQLPTLMELVGALIWKTEINSADPTASANPSLVISNNVTTWASTEGDSSRAWAASSSGYLSRNSKGSLGLVVPVLEIPNVVTSA